MQAVSLVEMQCCLSVFVGDFGLSVDCFAMRANSDCVRRLRDVF